MDSISRAKLLKAREFLSGPGVAVGVGEGDALGAKLIERAGFDFVWSSSLCVSASFAVPDANPISMSQYCDAARSMNEVISIPVIAGCDTGYGNANNLICAVKKFEEAGVVGISIEDKKFPKDNSLLEGGRQELAPVEEFAGKIKLFISANQPLRTSVKAQEAVLTEMKKAGGIHTIDDLMVSVSRVFDLQGVPAMKDAEKMYLVS